MKTILTFFCLSICFTLGFSSKSNAQPFIPMVNSPTMFGGGTGGFGPAFLSMIKTQQYDLLLKFTAKGSIQKYGAPKILDFYKSIKMAYTLKQVSASVKGDTTRINYTTTEYATARIKTFVVVVEADSVRLVLPGDLRTFLR